LFLGATFILMKRFDPERFVQLAVRKRMTHVFLAIGPDGALWFTERDFHLPPRYENHG
jgi:hypothetical protein